MRVQQLILIAPSQTVNDVGESVTLVMLSVCVMHFYLSVKVLIFFLQFWFLEEEQEDLNRTVN